MVDWGAVYVASYVGYTNRAFFLLCLMGRILINEATWYCRFLEVGGVRVILVLIFGFWFQFKVIVSDSLGCVLLC